MTIGIRGAQAAHWQRLRDRFPVCHCTAESWLLSAAEDEVTERGGRGRATACMQFASLGGQAWQNGLRIGGSQPAAASRGKAESRKDGIRGVSFLSSLPMAPPTVSIEQATSLVRALCCNFLALLYEPASILKPVCPVSFSPTGTELSERALSPKTTARLLLSPHRLRSRIMSKCKSVSSS